MRFFYSFVIATFVCAVAALDGAVATTSAAPIRSLFQACRSDVTKLCPKRRGILACLEGNATAVEGQACKEWLGARAACKEDVKNSKCAQLNFRRCLLTLDNSTLSAACSNSELYASMKRTHDLIMSRRKNRPTGVSESK